jgi:hypothetical protein
MDRRRERNLLLALTARAGLAAIAVICCDRAVNADESELLRPFIPAVSMDKDRRLLPEVFAQQAAQQQPACGGNLAQRDSYAAGRRRVQAN